MTFLSINPKLIIFPSEIWQTILLITLLTLVIYIFPSNC